MVKNTVRAANSITVPYRHKHIIDEGSAQSHLLRYAQIGSCLHQGHKAATSPGDNIGFSPGAQNLLHVGCEIGSIEWGKDVIRGETASTKRAGVPEGGCRTTTKSVIRSNVDEGFILFGQVETFIHGILVVIAAGAESVVP